MIANGACRPTIWARLAGPVRRAREALARLTSRTHTFNNLRAANDAAAAFGG